MIVTCQTNFAQVKPQAVPKTDSLNSNLLIEIPVLFGPSKNFKNSISSTSTVDGQTLNKYNTPKLGNSFYGQLSGLHVTQTDGAPGDNDNPILSIRGRQTFQDNSLIVLVDGFETDYNNLNPDEIESVSVLKDAASLSIYGLDGANGVVLIKTKRGKVSAKNEITFSSRFGVQEPTVLPEFLGNGDYAELYNIGLLSDGKDLQSGIFPSQAIVDFYKSGEYPFLYPDVNWYDEVLKPTTNSHNYGLNFRGGKEDVKYFVALSYLNQGGLYANTDPDRNLNSNYNFKRYNVRANFDVDITSFLTAQVNLRTSLSSKKYPNVSEAEIWNTLGKFNPYPVRTQSGRFGGTQGYASNPVASILQKGYGSLNDRTIDANVKIIGKLDAIVPGLSSFIQVNENNFYYSFYNKTRGFSYEEIIPLPNQAIPGEPIPFDRIIRGDTDKNFDINQPSGKQINRVAFLAGLEYNKVFGNSKVYASSMYYQDKFDADASAAPFARQNIMGRLNYSFKNKYFTEFSYAYSGSESFPENNRFGFFPSIAAGWVLTEEGFLKNSTNINFLKLRGSVGLTGSDKAGNSGRFIYNQFYVGSGTYLLGNNLSNTQGTFGQGALANPDVTYEKALKYDLGFDAILFKSLNLSANYFYEARKDIFLNPNNFIPAIIGTNFYNVNRGQTQNSGVELQLNYNGKINNFGYNVGGNISYAKNKIIDIAEPIREDTYLYAKGNPIGQPFVLQANGFFKDEADIQNSPQQLFGEVRPGDVKYKDQNNDGFIDDNDRIPVGNPVYPNTWYGFNAGFNVKGFDFNVLFQGAAGRDVFIFGNVVPFINNIKPTQWLKDNYWTPERGDNALFPRLTTEINTNNYLPSTLWQRSGDFLRLRNVELGYSLPQNILKKIKVSNARLYISGNNLFTSDNINEVNVDPEILNGLSHPSLKSYNVGLSITL
ncbi:MAG TPA: SusC/RagA family TonB-linked outer membrane protein [Pelobium sp.]|nr:SusC/RagA family TonB-linked outer membrane protein [Pelobium sp.]